MTSKHFKIHELVPKSIYTKYGEGAWKFISRDIIIAIDNLKEHFNKGTMTINNYYWNGDRNWSGLRTPDSPYYNPTSAHSMGKAVDIIFSSYDINEVREYIRNNHKILVPTITRMEDNVSWLHIDCFNTNTDELVIFNP